MTEKLGEKERKNNSTVRCCGRNRKKLLYAIY